MLNFVEGFLKIKFQNDCFLLPKFAKMDKLKSPSQAVLDRSSFYEAILIGMNQRNNNLLQSISQEFSQKLYGGIEERDGSEVINKKRAIFFRDQGYIRGINASEAD
jgi:hypothetical protein